MSINLKVISELILLNKKCKFFIYFMILSFSFSKVALADFIIDKEYCTLSNTFSGTTSDGISYEGVINLTFTSTDAALPLVNVSGLSRSIDPVDMSLSWPNADITDSQNRPLFLADFQSRLATEVTNTFNLSKETEGGFSVFYSRPYGFYRFQNLIALILSQNSLFLKFKNLNSDKNESLEISLAGSDAAFREVTRHCFSDSVSDYISENYSRTDTNPVHYVWSIGYGLTNYFVLEDLLPPQVKFPNDISNNLSSDSLESYQQFNQLYDLLNKKLSLVNSIREIELNSTYVNSQSLIRDSADQILALSNSRDRIGGSRGQLEIIEAELAEIEFKIENAKNFIENYEQNFSPIHDRKNIIQARIDILSDALSLIQQRILAAENLNQDYIQNINVLTDVINRYAEQYEAKITEQLTSEVLALPYSLESILASNTELENNQIILGNTQRKLVLLNAISEEINQTVELFVQFKELENQRSELLVQKVNQQQAYEKNQYDQVLLDEALGLLSFKQLSDFIDLEIENKSVEIATMTQEERALDASLKVSEVLKLTEDQVASSYSEYNNLLSATQNQSQDTVFVKIICKTDSFSFRYQGLCLNPLFLTDIKKIEIFVDQLSSNTLGELYFLITGDRSSMADSASQAGSRVQLISERILLEAQSDSANEIISKWKEILYIRWKFYVLRSQDQNAVYSFEIFKNALNLQKDESNRLKAESDQILAEIVSMDLAMGSLTTNLNNLEAEYFETLDKNQAEIIREINESGISAADINIQCLTTITAADICYEQYNLVQTQITDASEELKSDIEQTILFLLVTARTKIGNLNENLTSNLAALESLIAEKDMYIQTNNYNQVTADYQSAVNDVRQMQLRLKRYAEQQADALQRKSTLLRQQNQLQTDLSGLVQQINTITEQIRPTLLELKPLCEEKIKFLNDFEINEKAIYRLLALPEPTINMNSICQIEF